MRGQLIICDYDVFVPEQFGGHKTIGTGTEMADGYKSAVTDIISKSASYLEIGIDVFKGNAGNGKSESSPELAALVGLAKTLSEEIVKSKSLGDLLRCGKKINVTNQQGDIVKKDIATLQRIYAQKMGELQTKIKPEKDAKK